MAITYGSRIDVSNATSRRDISTDVASGKQVTLSAGSVCEVEQEISANYFQSIFNKVQTAFKGKDEFEKAVMDKLKQDTAAQWSGKGSLTYAYVDYDRNKVIGQMKVRNGVRAVTPPCITISNPLNEIKSAPTPPSITVGVTALIALGLIVVVGIVIYLTVRKATEFVGSFAEPKVLTGIIVICLTIGLVIGGLYYMIWYLRKRRYAAQDAELLRQRMTEISAQTTEEAE